MEKTLNDIDVQITSKEIKAIRKALAVFQALRSLRVDSSKLLKDPTWVETKHVLKTLESKGRLLSKRSGEFTFSNKLPVSFYFSLVRCLYLLPTVEVKPADVQAILGLVQRIIAAMGFKGVTE
jgi:hypothetical protein